MSIKALCLTGCCVIECCGASVGVVRVVKVVGVNAGVGGRIMQRVKSQQCMNHKRPNRLSRAELSICILPEATSRGDGDCAWTWANRKEDRKECEAKISDVEIYLQLRVRQDEDPAASWKMEKKYPGLSQARAWAALPCSGLRLRGV